MQETDCREKEEMQNLCATNGGTEQCCGDHRRRLELFCQEDEAFICVLCVPRHSCHSFVFLHDAVSVYKDKLKTSLSSLELKVRDFKDLQTKNETEFLEIQEHAVNLEKYIAEEFVKLHQFLHDKEKKLIYQLNIKAEILKELEENLECIKTGVIEILPAVPDTNLEIKKEVDILEERDDDTDYLTTTEESVSGDTSEHGKHKANGVLSAPESFEDVAVTFSAEEMKMLTKQDKELHKEVMLENYETLVSAGYKIPPEALLVLLKEDNAELQVNDKEGINRTEHKNNFKEKPNSNGSREWSISRSQQPSLGVSILHYPTENLQHSAQTVKGPCKHPVKPVAQLHPGYTCNVKSECDPSSIVQQNSLVHRRAHKEKKPYKCPECNKCFRKKGILIIHERTHMAEKPYKCAECSKGFTTSRTLRIHLSVHSGERPYRCPECSKCFRQKGGLVIHEKIHTGERPYKCPECNKCFIQRSVLVQHERTHSGEKPYKCPECSKGFTTTSNLRMHLSVHSGEKPYKCPDCNKCFRRRGNLAIHRRIHTGERPYKCAKCNRFFRHRSVVVRHERTHIG
ncbi:zinc finger protein 773-like [Protopterus annectens]|uniref:zinc finger protein 773-like n=1 Tax=Protopterus annectens TaxID=7888 RepID=UPI001CFC3B08|nr:zinc finger protein 773-like [Protopterus annectens]